MHKKEWQGASTLSSCGVSMSVMRRNKQHQGNFGFYKSYVVYPTGYSKAYQLIF